jgi:DNA-binding GntR family transcriptional regulator
MIMSAFVPGLAGSGRAASPAFPAKNTKATHLVDRLREAIVSGRLAPGTRINLEAARQEFGCSLSPLREALARLIAAGLVDLRDNRGYTVAPLSREKLAEITRLGVDMETMALKAAIAAGDLQWESEVMRSLHRLNRSERNGADPRSIEVWEQAHRDFHQTLLSGCGMPMLMNFCRVLSTLNERYRRACPPRQGGEVEDRNIVVEHSEIAQAAVARDMSCAVEALERHIRRTGDDLMSRFAGDGFAGAA